jgi:hypothetical protein
MLKEPAKNIVPEFLGKVNGKSVQFGILEGVILGESMKHEEL